MERNGYISLFFLWVTFLLAPSFSAKAMTSGIISYDISDGMADNAVLSIFQDRKGYIWVGTENGLNRFDGYSFKTYHHIPGDSTSLGSNYVFSLYEDPQGRLWIGTKEGIFLFNPVNEQFVLFDKATRGGIKINTLVSNMIVDGKGRLWISTFGQGVFVYDGNVLKQYAPHIDGNDHSLPLLYNYSLYIDPEDRVWVGAQTFGSSLCRYNESKDRFEMFPMNISDQVRDNLTVYTMTGDTDGHLWLGTWTHGLCRVDTHTGDTRLFLQPEGVEKGALHIHSILPYDSTMLLIGSDNGLHRIDLFTGEGGEVPLSLNRKDRLADRFIYPILRDREGGIWIGTYFGGLNYVPPPKGNIRSYVHSEKENSVSGNVISRFCEAPDGDIWIGSDDGGLSYLNIQTGRFTHYLPQAGRNSLSYHNIHALYMDHPANKLWIGTYSGGLNVLDLSTGRFKLYGGGSNIDNNSIYALYRNRGGTLWVGTMNSILTYNPAADNFDIMRTTTITTLDIGEDRNSNMWFATSGKGVYRYAPATNEWTQFLYSLTDDGTIPSNQVNCLAFDRDSNLWLGTENGLARFDPAKNRFHRVSLPAPSNSVNDIVCREDQLWLTTSNGLVCYHPGEETVRTFFKSDGLLSDQFVTKAAMLSSAGELYVGTINGFNVIDPSSLLENEYIPPVYITGLQIFNKRENISNEGVLNHSIEYTDTIRLSYKQNVFSIEYAALSYSAPDRNRYKYKMSGFDKEWNVVGNQRKATYTNLPPGKYDFQVIASNNDARWNETGASMHIIIRPPFWRTTLAYIFYFFLIIGGIVYIFYLIRKREEKRQNYRIRELERQKENELHESKIEFFTQIAHEIRTPVSLIMGPLENIKGKQKQVPAEVKDELDVIRRNSQRLLTLVNQLLDFRKLEEGSFRVTFRNVKVYDLLENIYYRFQSQMKGRNLNFRMDVPDKELTAEIDPEALTKVISNLLTNAYKHARSQVLLSCISEGSGWTIKVTDDGEGIPPAETRQIFEPFYQVSSNHKEGTGIGLSLVRQLINAHNGTIEVDSLQHIYTTFIIRLPLRQPDQAEELLQTSQLSDAEDPVGEPEAVASEPADTIRPALLLVEDNDEMLRFLVRIFSDRYQVHTATNGKEGLSVLKKTRIELIISDRMMPVMDGITFSKRVKENILYSHIPIILLTAKTDRESKISGMKAGADAYVEKPFSTQLLQVQVENLLASRKLLWRAYAEKPLALSATASGNKAEEKFLQQVTRVVEKNISNADFSVDLLAEALGISRSTMFQRLRSLTDMTPNELIHQLRLRKAAELLLSGNYRVSEICYQVGFNNPSYFSKCFQKQFGVTPKEFIRSGLG